MTDSAARLRQLQVVTRSPSRTGSLLSTKVDLDKNGELNFKLDCRKALTLRLYSNFKLNIFNFFLRATSKTTIIIEHGGHS